MEIELEDGFWWSFSRLVPDSHSSYHRDGSKTEEGKVKQRPCSSKQEICPPGWVRSFLWACVLVAQDDGHKTMDTRWWTQDDGHKTMMRGPAASHPSLFSQISSNCGLTAPGFLPWLLFRIVSEAMETIKYWLLGNCGISASRGGQESRQLLSASSSAFLKLSH